MSDLLLAVPNVSCSFPMVPSPDGTTCVCGYGTYPLNGGCVADLPPVGSVYTVPTMDQWALLATICLLAIAGWWRMR